MLMYADNKALHTSHYQPARAADAVSSVLDFIGDALETDGLSINSRKTVSIFLQSIQSSPMGCVHVMYRGTPIASSRSHDALSGKCDGQ